MRQVVCITEIPDPQAPFHVTADDKRIVTDCPVLIAHPSDVQAIMLALDLRDRYGGEVIAMSLGPPRRQDSLRSCLRLGVDQAMQLCDRSFEGIDAHGVSMILSSAVSELSADLVLTGYQSSIDAFGSQIGVLIAHRLGIPCVNRVVQAQVASENHYSKIIRIADRGVRELVRCPLPAVLTVSYVNILPQYQNLQAMITSEEATIGFLDRTDLGLLTKPTTKHMTQVQPIGLSKAYHESKNNHFFAPDTDLPAHERLLAAIAGGVLERQGEWVEGEPQEVGKRIIAFLKEIGMFSGRLAEANSK